MIFTVSNKLVSSKQNSLPKIASHALWRHLFYAYMRQLINQDQGSNTLLLIRGQNMLSIKLLSHVLPSNYMHFTSWTNLLITLKDFLALTIIYLVIWPQQLISKYKKMTKQIRFCPKICSSGPWPSSLVLVNDHDPQKMSVLDTMFLHFATF